MVCGARTERSRVDLANYPDLLADIAREALLCIPEETIRLLLESAIGDKRPRHSEPQHPLRRLEDWVKEGRPGTGEPMRRRRVLFTQAKRWLDDGKDTDVGLYALRFAMTPEIEFTETHPGNEDTITLRSGCLQPSEVQELWELWQRVLQETITFDALRLKPAREMVEDWAYPGRLRVHVPREFYDSLREYAIEMLQNLLTLTNDNGVLRWARQLSENLDVEIDMAIDRDFENSLPCEGFYGTLARGKTEAAE